MKLLIVSICVNYLDYLRFCYQYNRDIVHKYDYNIVTDSKDLATKDFCHSNNISCFITDEFYYNYQPFSKGRALNTFFQQNQNKLSETDYVLLLDSDCILSQTLDCFEALNEHDIECLYSCGRRIFNDLNSFNNNSYTQGGCNHIGFFQLFHKSRILNNHAPFYEHRNASFYDDHFARSFSKQKCLPKDVDHIGPIYMNWDGRHPQSKQWG